MFDEINVNGICHCGKIKINARVRDLEYINSRNLLVAYLEKKGSIVLINFNE